MKVTRTVITRKVKRVIVVWGMQIALGHGWITQEEYTESKESL